MPTYELAPNWYLTRIYSNRTARLLSLDMYSDTYKRKLYWFEFDRATRRWSLGEMRFPTNLNSNHASGNSNNNGQLTSKSLAPLYHVTYHALNAPITTNSFDRQQQQQEFANDGYTYLAVASESAVFISNNQSLILCHLDNETCSDYFRPAASSFQSQDGTQQKIEFLSTKLDLKFQ